MTIFEMNLRKGLTIIDKNQKLQSKCKVEIYHFISLPISICIFSNHELELF